MIIGILFALVYLVIGYFLFPYMARAFDLAGNRKTFEAPAYYLLCIALWPLAIVFALSIKPANYLYNRAFDKAERK